MKTCAAFRQTPGLIRRGVAILRLACLSAGAIGSGVGRRTNWRVEWL